MDVFTSDFAQAFWANLLASGAIAVAAYIAIYRRLAAREGTTRRLEISRDILTAVREELAHDDAQAQSMIDHPPPGELPYPCFDVNGWALISQATVFTVLEAPTLDHLLRVYNRMRTANLLHAELHDQLFGSTGALTYLVASASATERGRLQYEEVFIPQRDALAERFLDRIRELKPQLDEALTRVDHELERLDSRRGRD